MRKTWKMLTFTALMCMCLGIAAACGDSGKANNSAETAPDGENVVIVLETGVPEKSLGKMGDVCLVAERGSLYRKAASGWEQAEFESYNVEESTLTVTYSDGSMGSYAMANEAGADCTHEGLADAAIQEIYPAKCVIPGIGVQTCPDCHESFPVILPATGEHEYEAGGYTCLYCGTADYFKDAELHEAEDWAPEGYYVIHNVPAEAIQDGVIEVPGEIKHLPVVIGSDAFTGAEEEKLSNVVLDEGIVGIEANAFKGCESMTSIRLPESLEFIGKSAFQKSGITSASIPAGVTSIGDHAFDGCASLTSVDLPDTITSIAAYTFNECTALAEIDVPDTVTSIGAYAFYDCYSLTCVNLSENSDLITIGTSAFSRCYDLTSLTIPANVTTINADAFKYCYRLVEVYDLSTKLNFTQKSTNYGGVAYYALSVVRSAETPSKVKVDDDGFVFYENGANTYLIGYQGTATELVLPEKSADGNNYKFITPQPHALYNLLEVTSIKLPDNMTEIPDYMIQNCPKLMKITIPDGVTSIGVAAFNACTSLTSITIPASVRNIKTAAFVSCRGLKEVIFEGDGTNLTIATGAGTNNAFYACTSLASIKFGGTTEQFDNLLQKSNFLAHVMDPSAAAAIGSLTVTVDCTGGAKLTYIIKSGSAEKQ